jgi:hypothetical protein
LNDLSRTEMGQRTFQFRAKHAWLAATIGVFAAFAAWAGWRGALRGVRPGTSGGVEGRDQSTASREFKKTLAIIISGDTAGWIVPCGCTANQSGGLSRRASFVSAERGNADVIVADVGGAPGGASDYDRCKFEFILDGERMMGSLAHNLGGPELALGVPYLKKLVQEGKDPLISANARDREGKLLGQPFRIVSAGGRRIGLVGVVSPKFQTADSHIDDPKEAVLSTLPQVKGCDLTIVLAYLPEDELRQLSAQLPEVDAVIGGPTGQSVPPEGIGGRLVGSATNKGKFLVDLSIAEEAGRPHLKGRTVEMTDRFSNDPEQERNMKAFRRALAKQDFTAAQTSFAPQAIKRHTSDYAEHGSESCAACHPQEFAAWRQSGHNRAWNTLVERESQFDAACQRCHTTGFGAGGFESVSLSPKHVAVQCESCHGPSGGHLHQTETRTPLTARDQCVHCHDHENSPQFELAAYWAKIVHGDKSPSKTKDSP